MIFLKKLDKISAKSKGVYLFLAHKWSQIQFLGKRHGFIDFAEMIEPFELNMCRACFLSKLEYCNYVKTRLLRFKYERTY
uniref:Uncharacterized protein n=1 Tax=Romanomermis culicivorax TaxID=13658 RepID=A0A915K8S5_ROMCU